MKNFSRAALLSLVLASSAWATLPGTLVFEIRPTNGSASNGACFDATKVGTGTDYSQQNSAQYSFTDLVIGATTTNVTSVSHSFVTADVGNCLHISAGTGFTTGWFEIQSVATGIATLDRSAGVAASTGGTWVEGGAFQTIGQLNSTAVACNEAWVKAESTITTSVNIPISYANANSCLPFVAGYTSTRGDGGMVTVQATGGSLQPIMTLSTGGLQLQNFTIDCNSQTNTAGLLLNSWNGAYNLLVKNCVENGAGNYVGVDFAGVSNCFFCTVQNSSDLSSDPNSSAFASNNNMTCVFCVATGLTSVNGFKQANASSVFSCLRCIAANITGANWDGFQLATGGQAFTVLMNSVCYDVGRDCLRLVSSSGGNFLVSNNVFYGATEYNINFTGLASSAEFVAARGNLNWNAYGGAGTANLNVVTAGANDVTLASDPFVSGSTNNFALTTGGITALGGKGFPGTLAVGGTGYLDIGVLQHQASGGGSSQHGAAIIQ